MMPNWMENYLEGRLMMTVIREYNAYSLYTEQCCHPHAGIFAENTLS